MRLRATWNPCDIHREYSIRHFRAYTSSKDYDRSLCSVPGHLISFSFFFHSLVSSLILALMPPTFAFGIQFYLLNFSLFFLLRVVLCPVRHSNFIFSFLSFRTGLFQECCRGWHVPFQLPGHCFFFCVWVYVVSLPVFFSFFSFFFFLDLVSFPPSLSFLLTWGLQIVSDKDPTLTAWSASGGSEILSLYPAAGQ